MAIEMYILLAVGLVVTAAVIIYVIIIYNALVRMRNNIRKSWANIDVLLKQRSDELPKLVDTVKVYMKYEKEILTKLTDARTQFLNAKTVSEKASADNMITEALKSIFAVAENYPDLKANQSFMQLQTRISSIESAIADRREFYNDSVNEFNIKIQSFPDMYVANAMGFAQPETLFKAEEADKKDVKIKF